MSEWINIKDRIPEKSFKIVNMKCAVLCVTPPTEAKSFFNGSPEKKEVFFAIWSFRKESFPFLREEDKSCYKHIWGFFKQSIYSDTEEFLTNVTYWMPLPDPPID